MKINDCCKNVENLKEYKGDQPMSDVIYFCVECGQIWFCHTPFEWEKIQLKDFDL